MASNTIIQPVVLCGGSGTRLWPLSRKSYPKQFVPLIGGRSLLALTLERLGRLADAATGVLCVTGEEHRFLVRDAIKDAGLSGRVVLEPVGRNTAAAMAMAAITAATPEQLLLFCPSDHHIPDVAAFAAMVQRASGRAQAGDLVVFGVQPTFPSTAYGYIEAGEANEGGGARVARFIEKPDAVRAAELTLTGRVLWNAGIFLVRADVLLGALADHAPDILSSCRSAMAGASSDGEFIRPALLPLKGCRSESIDYAVVEHYAATSVFPFNGAWSDVGSWNAVAEMFSPDAEGNRLYGHATAIEAKNTFIHALERRVVVLGVDDLLVVDTPDAVLVTRRESAERVKNVVAQLDAAGCTEAKQHRKVARPWGWYDSVENGERFQVKRIVVNPGASLSLQKHFHRAEHWIVVSGTAEVTCGGKKFLLTENQSTYIPLGEMHRLSNPGRVPLEMIEVQSGSYLGEDDIVRMEDVYGRVGD